MRILRIVFLHIMFVWNPGYAQDSSSFQKFIQRAEFDITGAGYYQNAISSEVMLPGSIRNQRNLNNPQFNQTWKQATDNPLQHGAYYVAFHSKLPINQHITLWTSLIAEHRGFSYGVNNTANTIVFPQIRLDVNKKIRFVSDSLAFFGSIGNQMNPILYEGLTLYNLNQHGTDLHVKWKQFKVRLVHLSDLLNGIGLYVGDAYDIIGSYESKWSNQWQLNIQTGYAHYPCYDASYRHLFNFSIGLNSDRMRLYTQISHRPRGNELTYSEMFAGLIGLGVKKVTKKVSLESQLEGRYYGAGYNANFYQTGNVFYRQPGRGLYANTIGPNLYPLFMYDRPFSQWAVYAEYQNRNILALTWQMNSTYRLYKGLVIKAELDMNLIKEDDLEPFLYPFYQIGTGWQEGGNTMMIGVTNKVMNLDVHYPTFYLNRQPVFMVTIKRTISNTWYNRNK